MNKEVSSVELEKELQELDKEGLRLRNEAMAEGHKDEKCPKCETILLAHHHLIICEYASSGNCPMVKDTESLLDKLCPEKDEKKK